MARNPTSGPETASAGARRSATGRAILDRLLASLLVAAVAMGITAALTTGLLAQRIPYDDLDLGSVATATIKANRSYDIPDEETTRRMREEAVTAVRAVYEYDVGARAAILGRIADAFAYARSLLPDPDEAKGSAEAQAAARIPLLEGARDEIERRLGARLEENELAALARAGFPEEVEAAVSTLTSRAMREIIVGDREELAQHRSRGIAIRPIGRSGGVIEEVLSEVGGIQDLTTARARIDGSDEAVTSLPRELRVAVVNLARREIRSNLKADPELTRKRREEALAAVKPVAIQLKKGEKIIGDGERIEPRHLAIFAGMRAQSEESDRAQNQLGIALFAVLLILGLFRFARRGLGGFSLSRKDFFLLATLVVGMLFLSNLAIAVADLLRERVPFIPMEAWTYAIPFAAGPILIRFVLGAEASLLFTICFAALVGVLTGNSLNAAAFVLLGSVAGSVQVAGARDRAGLFRAGLGAAIAQVLAVISFALVAGQFWTWELLGNGLAAFIGGALFTPILLMALLAVVEGVLGYTTDLRLLELANLNHPALKELIVQAPGTYHHSIIVGTLVEAAAEEIGANPLLAKVCAYYHDLGKGRNALYFGENQRGTNRHDELEPEESARIIIEHVATGLELARKHKLPRKVAAAIPEHHGTRLVGYFYHKALRRAEEAEEPVPVDPERFRYGGPRPQSAETALVMMADAAEAASRSLAEPSPEKLRQLVDRLIDGIAREGQLDECELTLLDLSRIAASFCRTLESIYHSRPVYPAGRREGPPQEASEGEATKPAPVHVLRSS